MTTGKTIALTRQTFVGSGWFCLGFFFFALALSKLVGLHLKNRLKDELFTICRNYLPYKGESLPGQQGPDVKHQNTATKNTGLIWNCSRGGMGFTFYQIPLAAARTQ